MVSVVAVLRENRGNLGPASISLPAWFRVIVQRHEQRAPCILASKLKETSWHESQESAASSFAPATQDPSAPGTPRTSASNSQTTAEPPSSGPTKSPPPPA